MADTLAIVKESINKKIDLSDKLKEIASKYASDKQQNVEVNNYSPSN